MIAGVWDTLFSPPSPSQKGCRRGSQREQGPEELWLSFHLNMSVSNRTHTEKNGGPLVESWLDVSQMPARSQSQVASVPSRAGSWGFLGVVGVCAWGCDAWVVYHSGSGCGCCGEGHRDSGRSRWPFHWAPAGRSLLALWLLGEEGRKKVGETYEKESGRHRLRKKKKKERPERFMQQHFHVFSFSSCTKSVKDHSMGHKLRDPAELHSQHSNNTLTNIIDIPACTAQEGGSASKGHFTVGGGFHLHVAALCVLTSQPWWVSNGSIRILTIEGAGAVAAHRAFDVICSCCKTGTYWASTQMKCLLLT